MTQTRAIVSKLDKARLEPHLASTAEYAPIHSLRTFLETARAVPPRQVPPDIVTMNSRVAVRDPRDDSVDRYILTYPAHNGDSGSRPDNGEAGEHGEALSVLSPLGAVLLGAHEGTQITLMGARGARHISIAAIEYQPERAGDFDL